MSQLVKAPQRLLLEQMTFTVQESLSRYQIAHIAEAVNSDGEYWLRSAWSDHLVLTLQAYIWCRDKKTESHEYPKTWWDAFKLRWFPAWALKRWPAQMTRVEVTSGIGYPTLPSLGPGVSYGHIQIYDLPRGDE
jgi:hypothetical protein